MSAHVPSHAAIRDSCWMLDSWPAPFKVEPRWPEVSAVIDEVALAIDKALDASGLHREVLYCYCNESWDGRPLVAIHISSRTSQICLLEDFAGGGWMISGGITTERPAIRKISSDDDPSRLANTCVAVLVGLQGDTAEFVC